MVVTCSVKLLDREALGILLAVVVEKSCRKRYRTPNPAEADVLYEEI